ncbi:MAG: PAS domain S-box protein [bacterium]|nr:PAS domain S-box protein [bacterium]
MSASSGMNARLLVVEPFEERPAAASTAEALRLLGPAVALELHHEAPVAAAALRARHSDLVVLDHRLGDDLWSLLCRAREGATPALVIGEAGDEAHALRAFRAGATGYVERGPAFAENLSTAAREQLQWVQRIRGSIPSFVEEKNAGTLDRYSRNIIENMNSALLVINREGAISYANPTAERALGVGDGELEGRDLRDWFPGAEAEEILPLRTVKEGTRFRGVETVLTRADGTLIPTGISCAPLVDAEGVGEGAVAIFQDLVEIKQLQRQVLQTEKMASIGQLAAGVAHEINNPMGFIHANLSQLTEYLDDLQKVWAQVEGLRGAADRDPADAQQVREAARALGATIQAVDAGFLMRDFGTAIRESLEGSERIRAIVTDLRAFSHQDTAERALCDINRALDSTANIVWTMMKHSVVLTKQYEELAPMVGFPMQLKQVFMNLLVNAYQAIEERAAREELRGEIRLRTELQGEEVLITVTDNGVGMPKETLDRIFDPFFTTKEVGVGTGLGLSTSFNLIKNHGGTLRAQSEVGRGTSFEVRLPLGDPDELL